MLREKKIIQIMGNIGKNLIVVFIVVVLYGLSYGGRMAEAEAGHHVVGDRGWDSSSDVESWVADRTFNVGDFIWFAYSAGKGKDNVVEVRTKEEYEACDVSNPIRMYTDGVNKIPLQEEGIRYFASSNPHNCKRGLKLPVNVRSKSTAQIQSSSLSSRVDWLAEGPTTPYPSSAIKIGGPIMMIIVGVVLSYVAP